MSIWGRRDGEPPAEGAHEGRAEAQDTQEPAAEHQAGEPAPAFWRAQGQTPTSPGRDPADATPPVSTGTETPAPVLTGVVIDGETAVKDPALTGTAGNQAGTHGTEADPAVTEVPEPTVAVAREPVVNEPPEQTATEAGEPVMAQAQEPATAKAQEPAGSAAQEPATATGAAQRWSEILVAFVDDPRDSVKMAAGAVDEAIDEFVSSVRARQRALASSWQGTEAGTEQLRTALRGYRTLWHQVRQLDLGEKTGR